MKKIISLALSVILLLSTILAVPQVFAQSAVSITNTYEEANLTTTNASLFGTNTKVVTKAANIAGGNTTKVAEFQNVCGSLNTNATAVKIYDPSDNDFAAFVPEKNANYKITFEYYAKKGVTYPLECIIYGNTDNTTFKGDKLASAVYIATDDANYASSAWREATVYISTGNKEYKSLSINAEFVGAEGSPSQWVRLDNVKLVQIASNHDSETTTIIAGSDFQHQSGTDEGIEVMDDIFSSINSSGITSADGFFFLGDYDYDSIDNYANTREGLNAVNNKAQEFSPSNTYLLQGNHDNNTVPGISKSGPNDPSSGKYGVYIINEDDYTWKNDDEQTIKNTAQNLVEYLNAKLTANYDKPIFILSHLSLHYSMRTKNDGDGQYANYIFDVLNEAGSKGLNIVFMYGHNHSNGWDDYLGGSSVFLNKGDNILIAQSSKTKFESFKLNFYYLNAGYVGYYGNHNGADDALTMTSIQFNSSEIVFKRYDSQGIHSLKGAGKTNAYKGETGYDPNTTVYASPLTAQLTSVTDSTPLTDVIKSNVTVNTYDESGLTKDKLVGSGIQTINTFSSSGNDTKVLQFNNFSGSSSITGVKIYNPNDSNFASFVPQKGKTYEISFKYRTYYGNYNDLYINVRGTTGTDLSGDILSNAVVIPKKDANFKDEVWREASVKVTIDKDYTGLAIAFEADGLASGTLPRWSMLDDVQVVEAEPDEHQEVGVINTYDNIGLTKDKLVGSGMQTISTFADTGNGTKVLQFNSFSGADGINGVKIYDQNDSNFTAFVPEKNTVYKVEFKYNTYMSNYYALQINVKGTTGNASLAGETLCNAVTIDKADSNYSSEIWRDATAYFNTGDNNYTGIAITFEAVGAESSIPRWSMLDDIKLTVIENATSDIVFHNYVGDGSDKTLTVDNTYTFDNLKTPTADGKKFAGFYLDSTFNTEAKGYIYGVTELWVKWRTANDADKIINTYDDEGVYYAPYGQYGYTRRYSDSDLTNCIDSALAFPHFILGEIAEDVGVDGTKAVWFKSNTTEANKYPSAVRIYDSSSANKELYVPRKNSVYKVSIKYKSTVERYHPVSIVIKGMTDTSNTFGSGVALGTIASIPGSTIVKNWETAECYIVTDNTDFVCFGIYSMTSGGASYNSGGELYIDDVEITEIFDVNTLTLELNGGKGTQSIPFIAGEKPARLPTPEKNGYIFAGWYIDSTLTKVFAIDVMPDEDVTLYAKWEPIVSTAEIFKTGFENDDYDNDVTPYINGKDTNNNTDSAIWEESYDEAYEGERYIHLDNVAYSAVDTPRHAAVALVNPDGSYYQVVEGQRYKLNYAMRTDNYVRIVLAVSDDVPTKGLSVSTTDVQFERHYHILWYHPVETWGEMEEYFTATATGKVYLLTYYHAEYLDIDDITLTPVSEGDANLVEFYNEGGTLISSTLGGSGKLMTAPTPPKKDGYVFDGWRDENGVQYISSNFPTSDMKLYASYRTADNTGDVSGIAGTKNYDFEGEDEKAAAFYGSGTNAYSHDWGEYFVTNDEDGAHSGSSYFYFWNAGVWTKANYSRFRVFDPDSKGNMVYLEPNSVYRIKFWMRVDNIWSGGLWLATMETNELTVINNEYIASLSEADMGDNFGKWIQYEATIITGEEISTLGVELSGGYFTGAFDDFTVEKLSKYTVTFDSNGGSQVESKQAFDGDYIVAPAYPEKDGFIFDGWYADKELTSKFKFNKTSITGNITLYAKWVKVEEQEYKTVITYTQEEQEVANEEYDSAPDEQITVNKNDKIGQVNGENGQFNWWIIIVVAAVVLIAVSTFLIVFIIKKKKKN